MAIRPTSQRMSRLSCLRSHERRAEETEYRAGCTCGGRADRRDEVDEHRTAERAEPVERTEPKPAQMLLQRWPQHVQRPHVEQDVGDPEVHECRGDQAVVLTRGDRGRPQHELPLQPARGEVQDEHHHVDGDQRVGDHRLAGALHSAEGSSHLGHGCGGGGDAVDALVADGGAAHALRADGSLAAGAPDIGLPVGVAVTGRRRGRGLRWVRDAHGSATEDTGWPARRAVSARRAALSRVVRRCPRRGGG